MSPKDKERVPVSAIVYMYAYTEHGKQGEWRVWSM